MRWKFYILTVLCVGTITACAQAPKAVSQRRMLFQQRFEATAKVSQGACDEAGQMILTNGDMVTLEASAAPAR